MICWSCRKFLSVTEDYDEEKFFTKQNGARVATPLLLVLAVIELSDVVFAVDSIPAVSTLPHYFRRLSSIQEGLHVLQISFFC